MTTTAVIKAADAPTGVREILTSDAARQAIAPLLMPGVEYDRVIAAAHYAVRQTPQLADCTPASIIDAVSRIQQWQLEIGLTAHLVPFGKVCTPIADYKGLVELMIRSKAVRNVEARVVYEGDKFQYSYGLDAMLQHIPNHSAKQRGKITHAYVILRLPFGAASFDVMPIEDIDEIRQRYSKQWKNGPVPAWYAKKTLVRQAAKFVPKDPRLASALAVIREDEEAEFGSALLGPSPAAGALPAGRSGEEEVYDTVRSTDQQIGVEGQSAETDAPTHDLTWAKAYGLPFPKHKHAGEPIDGRSTEELQGFLDWAVKKIREAKAAGSEPSDMLSDFADALELILNDRAKDQLRIELDADDAEPKGEQRGDPTPPPQSSSTSIASESSDSATSSETNAITGVTAPEGKSVRQLTKEIDFLARSGKIPGAEIDAWMKQKISRDGMNHRKLQDRLDHFNAIVDGQVPGSSEERMPAALQADDDDLPF